MGRGSTMDGNRPTNEFSYEADLVAHATALLKAGLECWGITYFALEFEYRLGRTDIVAISESGDVIAIEAKLSDWREALQQAYRSTSFAVESYILMPLKNARRAVAHVAEFEIRGVGICAIDDGQLTVLHPAKRQTAPLEPWLAERAARHALSSGA